MLLLKSLHPSRPTGQTQNQTLNHVRELLQFQHQQTLPHNYSELEPRSTDHLCASLSEHQNQLLANYSAACGISGDSSARRCRSSAGNGPSGLGMSKSKSRPAPLEAPRLISPESSGRANLSSESLHFSPLELPVSAPPVAPRGEFGSTKRLSIIQEETAHAMVGLMRLILVILICVLLVKLRAPRAAVGGRRRRAAGPSKLGSSDSSSEENFDSAPMYHNYSNNRHKTRETRISNEKKQSISHQLGFNSSRRPSEEHEQATGRISAISTATAVSSSTNSNVQQARRHSQPHLASSNIGQHHQHYQPSGAHERRRRHSDTSATLLASLSLPPGPMGLPFLGYLPFLGNEIHLTLTELANRFGPIYQIFLGGIRVVVLNDAALVRQAFKQTVFSGRPDTQLTRILQGYGIVNSDGALWKEQRAFLHTALRKLGAKSLMNGSNGLEAKIQNQVKEFVSDLSVHASEGKPCQVRPIVARAVSSVVGSIVMNLTYRKYEEKEKFDRLIELMQEGFRLFSIAMPLDFIPIFRFLPGVSYAYKKMKRNRAETSAFFQGVADEHRRYLSKTFNLGAPNSTSSLHPRTSQQPQQPLQQAQQNDPVAPAQQQQQHQLDRHQRQPDLATGPGKQVELDNIVARDLVDAYIVQQKKHEKDGKENYFSDQQLVQIMSDIFSAGLETVTSTIEWSILFLILNPECQARIQDEIDRVVGRDRLPQLEHLSQMPYTEATIYEVLRRSNVVALGNAHATLADASIGGYRIPKGTQVLPNLYGIHMNPKLWAEPQRFDPSRFIVNDRAQKPDYFIPFSVGRRMCLGDVLAKMEVFLFLVGLLQKYDLAVHEDDRQCPPQVKGTIGVSNAPVSFRVAISSREQTNSAR